MNRRIIVSLLLSVMAAPAMARFVQPWSYQQMFDKADLVVVAKVLSTKETDEQTTILDLNVIGVTTDFKALLVLKGPKSVDTFQLHHYKLRSDEDENIVDGPSLVRVSQRRAFLLFLTKEPDGRYAPVTGQCDPAAFSVVEVTGTTE